MQILPDNSDIDNNQFGTLPHLLPVQATPLQVPKQQQSKQQDCPFFGYFVSKTKGRQNLIEVQQKYNKNLQQKLQNQIQEGKTILSKKQKINLEINKGETEEQQYLRQKRKLQQKKKIFKESLSRVLEEEQNLLHKNASILRHSRQRSQTHFQAANPKWKEEVFLSLKKLKQFQGTVKQKDKNLEDKIQNMRLRDFEDKAKFLEALKIRNRNQVLEKHERYQTLKEQQMNERKKCQLLVRKMKPDSYKFQKVQQLRMQELQRMQSQRKFQEKALREQKITISRKALEAHQQAYVQTINERKQRWITQFHTFKAENRTHVRHYSGMFLQKVIEEQNRMKEQTEQKQLTKIETIRRAQQYSQYVKDSFRPKIIITLNPQKQQKGHPILSRVQVRTKGIQNLKFVKEKVQSIKNDPEKYKRIEQRSTSLPKLNNKTEYKDYLKEQPSRIKRELSTKSGFEAVLTEKKSDWLQHAYTYIEKLQKKQSTKKGRPLIQAALRKLQLLNALY